MWLQECLLHHKETCQAEPAAKLPSRVIEVGLDGDSVYVRSTRRQKGVWVALSHCWGSKAHFTLDSKMLTGRNHPILLQNMPAAFRDAISITRRLGYRYLRIDSLCILQDVQSDWVAESSRMQDYYKHAVFTITADLSTGNDGFLHYSRPKLLPEFEVPFWKNNLRAGSFFVRERLDYPWTTQSPLHERAWTLQESMLSCRVLHFSQVEQYWDCQKHFRCESNGASFIPDPLQGGIGIKHFFLAPRLSKLQYAHNKEMLCFAEPQTRWLTIVSNYVERAITYEKDRLPALSGVAKEIHLQTNMVYKAGIWMADIHRGLLWSTIGTGLCSSNYIAPSWSWASQGRLLEHYRYADLYDHAHWTVKNCEPKSSLIECEVVPLYGDPYGQVESGRLDLRGPWIPATRLLGDQEPYLNGYWRDSYKTYMEAWADSENREQHPEYNGQIICDFGRPSTGFRLVADGGCRNKFPSNHVTRTSSPLWHRKGGFCADACSNRARRSLSTSRKGRDTSNSKSRREWMGNAMRQDHLNIQRFLLPLCLVS